MFTKIELSAIAHALGNVLCQRNLPDWDVLDCVREKIRLQLQAPQVVISVPELFMAAKNALDVMPPGPKKDALVEALLPPPGK